MDIHILSAIAYAAALTCAATGSVFGTGIAGMAAIGAAKKCFQQSRKVPFALFAFVGAPLTQTVYGYLLMNTIIAVSNSSDDLKTYMYLLTGGVLGGMVIGFAGYMQGKAGAAAADAHAETGKGFGNFMMILGVIESVALFVMIFIMVTLNQLG